MKRLSLVLFPCLLPVILASLFVSPTFAHGISTSPTTCGQGWSVVSSPNKKLQDFWTNELSSVAAISSTDIWAVGVSASPGGHGGKAHALTEHWNGTAWSIVPVASPRIAELRSVAAVATNDVWAVGWARSSNIFETLIEHWDGTTWSIVPSPNRGYFPQLEGVVAVSANDIWAVGGYDGVGSHSNIHHALIEHWNGTAWSIIPNPAGPSLDYYSLSGVTAVSTTDVWAVGSTSEQTANKSFFSQSLFEHWDGKNWKIVVSPTLPGSFLRGVVAASATDVWAVGSENNQTSLKSLIEHWDGTQWAIVASPNPSSSENFLNGVAAISATDVWAVGSTTDNQGKSSTLIVHWDGTAWKTISSPQLSHSALNGLTLVPGTTSLWTVGTYSSRNQTRTLTEFYC